MGEYGPRSGRSRAPNFKLRHYPKFYVWFSQQCDRKMALLQPAVDAFNARHGEVATLSLHPGRVEPGPDTVMFGGPHWKPE